MKYSNEVLVLGMKASKGVLDNGQAYDSTKVYVVMDMDDSKGNAVGQMAGEFPFGTSGEIEKFRGAQFPLKCVGDFELVGNGKTMKPVCVGLKPIEAKKA